MEMIIAIHEEFCKSCLKLCYRRVKTEIGVQMSIEELEQLVNIVVTRLHILRHIFIQGTQVGCNLRNNNAY